MAEQLRPCPFCGHVGLEIGEGSTFRWLSYSCGGCGIGSEVRVQTSGEGSPVEWREKAKTDAIETWNTRAQAGPAAPQGVAICVHCSSPNTASVRVIHCRECGVDSVEPVAASESVASGASSQPMVDDSPAPAHVAPIDTTAERVDGGVAGYGRHEQADEIVRLRAAAQQARHALSELVAGRDPVVYSDALRALDEVLGVPDHGEQQRG